MNRYRSRGSLKAADPIGYVYTAQSSGGIVYPWAVRNTQGLKVGSLETMIDVETSKYKARSKKGERIFNPLDQASFEYSRVDGNEVIVHSKATFGDPPKPNSWVTTGPYFDTIVRALGQKDDGTHAFTSDIDIDSLMTEASTKVLAERGATRSNSFESVAQIGQTIDLLKNPISALFKMVKQMKKEWKNPPRERRIFVPRDETPKQLKERLARQNAHVPSNKDLIEAGKLAADRSSSLWLSYRYGLLPLISDINMIIEGLSKDVGQRVEATTRANLHDSTSSYYEAMVSLWPDDVVDCKVGIQKTDDVKVHAMSLDEHVVSLGENFGFTARGLFRTPWDLIPLSFVEDWFTNFSDYMLQLTPALGYKNLGSSMSVTRTSSVLYVPLETTVVSHQASTYDIFQGFSGQYYARGITKTRRPLSAPGIVIKNDFKFDKLTRQADAIALLYQQLQGALGRPRGRILR